MTIIALRKKYKLTQSELAKIVGIGQSTLAGYESGVRRPRPEIAEKIGKALGLDESQIWKVFYAGKNGAN